MITSNGFCKHVNGTRVTRCINAPVYSLSSCEAFCTSQKTCVGYHYSASDRYCALIPSDSSCLSGFSLHNSETNLATSKNDLVAYSSNRFVCYGKNSGKQLNFIGNYITNKISRFKPILYVFCNCSKQQRP